MSKYSIGIDYGTLSGRAMVVNIETGEELDTITFDYPHKVMCDVLPDGKTKLSPDWALQHPQDYLDVLYFTIPEVLKKAGVSAENVIGVGIDFTACTVLPVLNDGTPLCFLEEYKNTPHAYVKLWKHHAAQDEANKLNEKASEMSKNWLQRYGGKISSEWLFPKIWQVLDEDPVIYQKADNFIEAADWIVWQLTGVETRNSCTAGYKAIWNKKEGYPSNTFFNELDVRLNNIVEEKLSNTITSLGQKAGEINEKSAKLTGLKIGTAVAVGNIDAHVAVPALKMNKAGQMLMIIGTSTCHLLLAREEKRVPGICGVVEDGILPNLFGYEAGQSCVGDHFEWFVKNLVPTTYIDEAEEKGITIFNLLNKKATDLKVGESGLIALDWWNGNRSVLVDANLTGVILGMSLLTKPEEIYRALIEATAYGTRMIIETFLQYKVPIDELFAAGGIAEKDSFTIQVYADVIGMEIKISGSPQAPALGSAIFGAVAAGKEKGGYDSVSEASNVMGKLKELSYIPNLENKLIYDQLFLEYKKLHDYFGKGENDVMKRLKGIRETIKNKH